MSKSDNSSPDSENSSNNAIYITIQDTNSEPPIIPDEQLDNENNSNSSSPPKNFSNISFELENYRCDSPITMSYNGSRGGSYDGSQPDLDNNKQNEFVHIAACSKQAPKIFKKSLVVKFANWTPAVNRQPGFRRKDS